VDETYMLWNGSEDNRNVRNECEEDKHSLWIWRRWHWLVKVR